MFIGSGNQQTKTLRHRKRGGAGLQNPTGAGN